MTNKLDRILLSFLLGTSVLLGLAFWLNTVFGFNLFYKGHWDELAQLQALNIAVSNGFYISIAVAIFVFVFGLYIIYMPAIKRIHKKIHHTIQPDTIVLNSTQQNKNDDIPVDIITAKPSRPPRLDIPVNMANVAAQQHAEKAKQQKTVSTTDLGQNPYNPILAQIFSDNGYTVKTNPSFSGFIPNLFAIGPGEILWIGAVDQDMDKLHQSIKKLQSVFNETLEDIQINIHPFMLDTLNQYQSDDTVIIFKTIDELKKFISDNPADANGDSDQESFDAYSEYIDTITQYIKNI